MKLLVDHRQIETSRERAARMAVPGADFLLQRALDDLTERLMAVSREFEQALCLGPLADQVCARLSSLNQIGACAVRQITVRQEQEVIDLEGLEPDMVVALYALHETNDTPGILTQLRQQMREDGLFMACLPGSGTLHELRQSLLHGDVEASGGAHARIMPFSDVRVAGALLQRAGFALPVTDVDTLVARYDTAFDLMRDLRAMGATNALTERGRSISRRGAFFGAGRYYGENFADDDGRIRATFNTLWLSGWSPSSSQAKPLKPGSAQVSLTKVLGNKISKE